MITTFIQAFPAYRIEDVIEMDSALFFTFYEKIDSVFAIRRIQYVESHLLAKARQYATKSEAFKVETEYRKIHKLAEKGR